MRFKKAFYSFFPALFGILFFTCKDKPFKPNFENAGGYVIGKERCNTDTTKDYWLIDLSIFPLQNNFGDTLDVNGTTYNHLVKTLDLAPQFKSIGKRVDFDFNLTATRIQTNNCNTINPLTFLLRDMKVFAQGEIR